jgi:hypothetical protein
VTIFLTTLLWWLFICFVVGVLIVAGGFRLARGRVLDLLVGYLIGRGRRG